MVDNFAGETPNGNFKMEKNNTRTSTSPDSGSIADDKEIERLKSELTKVNL
jgi:hypothetical protein